MSWFSWLRGKVQARAVQAGKETSQAEAAPPVQQQKKAEHSAPSKGDAKPEVQRVNISTRDPYLAAALFVRFISEHGCGCGGKWEKQSGDLYLCSKCGTKKRFQVYYG